MSVADNALFLTTAGGIVIGIISLVLRYCYKMKCDETNFCCGLLKFNRNINDEMNIDLQNNQLRQNNAIRRLSTGTTSQFNLFANRTPNNV